MADVERDRTKTDGSPESTWGASEEAKTKWQDRYGKAAQKAAEAEQREKKD